ncbi:MAG: hypothetical protein ACKOB6_01095 [Candidatus Kapaibacterium sp.]
MTRMRYAFVFLVGLLLLRTCSPVLAQCCAGGNANPIAGGASQSVLQEGEWEAGMSVQGVRTHTFLSGSEPASSFMDEFTSLYLYSRVAYGLSDRLTLSAECGSWPSKKQIGFNASDTNTASGIGDVIILPRACLYRSGVGETHTEVTLGMGMKIPVGSPDDSVRRDVPFVGSMYFRKPLSIQLSSGAQDLIFTAFVFRGNTVSNVNLFANAVYIRKGWNPSGEKLGDFFSMSVFGAAPLFTACSGIMQLRGEWVGMMRINPVVVANKNPGYEPKWTGSRKLFVSPQANYMIMPSVAVFALADIPVYQYVNGTQVASAFQATLGLNWRWQAED